LRGFQSLHISGYSLSTCATGQFVAESRPWRSCRQ
jgi:hypothetical protein